MILIVALIAMERAMPTSADTSARRHEVLRTRRDWRASQKRTIVAPGANVSAIARRHGVAQSLIYQWRKIFNPSGASPAFLPVAIAAPAPIEPANSSMIEVVLANGLRVRTDAGADPVKVARLIAALDGDA